MDGRIRKGERERESEGLSRYTLGVFSMTLPGAIIQCDMTTHAHTEWVLEGVAERGDGGRDDSWRVQ